MDAAAPSSLRFGVISTGRGEAARAAWLRFLDAVGRRCGQAIEPCFPDSYAQARDQLVAGALHCAWLSCRAALDAIDGCDCAVFAQMVDARGSSGYRGLLIGLAGRPPQTLDELVHGPGRFRLALGESASTSGYLMPMLGLFGPRRIDPQRHFLAVRQGTHRQCLQALVDGEVDVAAYNTEEWQALRVADPGLHARLAMLWQGAVQIPKDPLLWRLDLPQPLRVRLAEAVIGYGDDADERRTLVEMFDLAPFQPAANAMLRPILDYAHYRESLALLNDPRGPSEARTQALAQLNARYERLAAKLGAA
jgi:phosphonate transport system substrate-binding protein